MTEEQRLLFRKVLDLNWEYAHETDWDNKFRLASKLSSAKNELRESMGNEAYDEFIETGRRMFAPKGESVDADYEMVDE